MKIVIISECKAREMLVVDKVLTHFPRTVVLQPTFKGRKKKKRSLSTFINKALYKIRYRSLKKLAEKESNCTFVPNLIPFPADQINTKEGIAFIKSLQPDLLVTCRAPLLKPEIITIPKIAAINLHYGIAPNYRGNDTLFWALYHNDFEHIGGTIHHISQGVDTGNILAKAYPSLSPDDNETTLDIKTSKLLADALVNYLQVLVHSDLLLTGLPQTEKGSNFKAADRTLYHNIDMICRNMTGTDPLPYKKERVETYYKPENISLLA